MAVLEREASGAADLHTLSPLLRQAFLQALNPQRSQRLSIGKLYQAIVADVRGVGGQPVGGVQ